MPAGGLQALPQLPHQSIQVLAVNRRLGELPIDVHAIVALVQDKTRQIPDKGRSGIRVSHHRGERTVAIRATDAQYDLSVCLVGQLYQRRHDEPLGNDQRALLTWTNREMADLIDVLERNGLWRKYNCVPGGIGSHDNIGWIVVLICASPAADHLNGTGHLRIGQIQDKSNEQ